MGGLRSNLMSGEQVVYRTKLHWIVFLGPIIFVILAFIFFASGKEIAPVGSLFFLIAIVWGSFSFHFFQNFGIWNNKQESFNKSWVYQAKFS